LLVIVIFIGAAAVSKSKKKRKMKKLPANGESRFRWTLSTALPRANGRTPAA